MPDQADDFTPYQAPAASAADDFTPYAPPAERSFLSRAADGARFLASKFADKVDMGEAEKAFSPENRADLSKSIDQSKTLADIGNAVSNLGTMEVPTGTEGNKRFQVFDVPHAAELAIGMGTAPLIGADIMGAEGATAGERLLAAHDLIQKSAVGMAGSAIADKAIESAYPGQMPRHARVMQWLVDQGVQTLPFLMPPHVTAGLELRGALESEMERAAGEDVTPTAAEQAGVPAKAAPKLKLAPKPATEPEILPKDDFTPYTETPPQEEAPPPEPKVEAAPAPEKPAESTPEPKTYHPEQINAEGQKGEDARSEYKQGVQRMRDLFRAAAIRVGDKIYEGKPGQLHGEIYGDNYGLINGPTNINRLPAESGFVTKEGQFLTNNEASEHADTFADALKLMDDEDREQARREAIAEAEREPTAAAKLEKLPDAPPEGIATSPAGGMLARLEAAPWGKVKLIPTDMFEPDPERFQFKLEHGDEGQSGSFTPETKFNPDLVGTGLAYYDAETDKLHPVNMHNRLWLAKKDGFPYLPVQVVDSGNALSWATSHNASAADARALGALQNIAEGRGNAIDAAQYLRDSRASLEDMKAIGLNLSNQMVRDARGLQNLDEGLWQLVKLKAVEPDKAAIIGEEIPDDKAAQREAFNWLKTKTDAGKTVTQDFMRDMAEQIREAGSQAEDLGRSGDQIGLGGMEQYLKKSLFEEQAQIIGGVRSEMVKARNAFANAAKNATRLEEAGNVIAAEENRGRAAEIDARLKEIKRWVKNPQMRQIVREAAQEFTGDPRKKNLLVGNAIESLSRAADEAAVLAPKDAPPPQMSLVQQDDQTGALFQDAQTGQTLTGPQAVAKTRDPGFSLSGGFPGAKQLVDILTPEAKYHAEQMARRGKGLVTYLRTLFAPQTVGPLAKRAGQIWIEAGAERAAKTVSDEVALQPLRDFVASQPGAWRDKYANFYGPYERGEMPDVPAEQRPLIERIRRAYAERRETANQLRIARGRTPIAELDNYLSHLYADDPSKVREVFQGATSHGSRPLTSGTPFTKQRTYLSIMDAIQQGLTPRYENPIDEIMAGFKQYDKYIMAETMFRNMEDAGLLRFYKPGEIPDGWAKIDDSFFKVSQYAPAEHGFIERGTYAAPEEAARVINKQLAPVPESIEPFVNLVGPGSAAARINAMRVGFSAYHFVNVNSALMAQTQGVGMARMLHGLATLDGEEIANGAKIFGGGLVPGPFPKLGALNEAFTHGDKLMRALVEPGTQGAEYDEGVRAAIMGGMRVKPEQVGTLGDVLKRSLQEVIHPMVENRSAAAINKPAITSAVNRVFKGAFDTADASSAALMQYYIPRIKLGAFYKLAAQELDHYATQAGGNIPFVLQREILQNVGAHVDSLFGQMVDDNLFMGRSLKTALHLLIGYPSWNIGSARLGWNAAKGALLWGPAKLGLTRALNSQERLAMQFAGGLMTSQAIQNAMLMRMLTGAWPKTVQDYFQPQDGGKDAYGNPTRVAPPSYMRTYLGMATHPVQWAHNILNFWIGALDATIHNRDPYTGRQVWDPDAPLPVQMAQFGAYHATHTFPFSFSNMGRLAATEQGKAGPARYGRLALGALGFTPSPEEYNRTKAENYVISTSGENVPHQGLNDEQYNRRQARIALADALREGKPLDPAKYEYLKKLSPANRQAAMKEAIAEAKYPRIVGLMRKLTLPQVLHTYEIARDSGDAKNEQYAKIAIQEKFARATHDPSKLRAEFEALDPEVQERYRDILREALGLPKPAGGPAAAGPES